VFTWPQFLFFQHNQQYDTLLHVPPPPLHTHKLKAELAYLVYCTNLKQSVPASVGSDDKKTAADFERY
jgi:hypothetical protein